MIVYQHFMPTACKKIGGFRVQDLKPQWLLAYALNEYVQLKTINEYPFLFFYFERWYLSNGGFSFSLNILWFVLFQSLKYKILKMGLLRKQLS